MVVVVLDDDDASLLSVDLVCEAQEAKDVQLRHLCVKEGVG
jgi:hypothetical protein